MKIVHIATLQDGGAGKAAERLHQGLLEQGIDSTFLCAIPKGKGKGVIQASPDRRPLIKRVLSKTIFPGIDRSKRIMRRVQLAGGKYEFYSLPFSGYSLEDHEAVQSADIINFHWVSNFVNFPTFFKVRKPIVWTLHDMNPFMGGFHYKNDFLNNSGNTALMAIETTLHRVKSEACRGNDLTICTPSEWLGKESMKDEVMRTFPHHRIPYGLDTHLFRPYPREFCREIFGLPADKKVFLFISTNLNNKRKGFDLLKQAINEFDAADLTLLVVGANAPAEKHTGIHYLDAVQDDLLLSLLYSAADACVIPSLEDNLPNILLESLSCGTPVLGLPVGGLPDFVKAGFNGHLSQEATAASLAATMRTALNFPFDRAAIREFATEHFALSVQASKYIRLYREVLERATTIH